MISPRGVMAASTLGMALAGWCGSAKAEDDLTDQVSNGLKRATTFLRSVSTRGGYAGIYSKDGKKRYGEARYEKVRRWEIWVQPPGTPTVGESFLRAYRVTRDPAYLEAARQAGLALAWGQRKSGGWDHRVDLRHLEAGRPPRRKGGHCTFDDDISQGALTFLMDLDRDVDAEWLTAAIGLARRHLRRAQYPNGAWPQWFPLRGRYHDHYTFNDSVHNDCIRVLLRAHRAYRDPRDLRSALRGGEFILAAVVSKQQPGWAQQYSRDMKPAWARAFEPPGVCSAVTARNIRTLIELHLLGGDVRFLQPIPAAIAWLKRSRLPNGKWARLYEVGTNRPIYGDRDRKIHYTLAEVSGERRTGYAWQRDFGVTGAIEAYRQLMELGREEVLARRRRSRTAKQRAEKIAQLRPRVRKVLAALDAQGRWIDDKGWITTKQFVRNVRVLCDYLALTRRWF